VCLAVWLSGNALASINVVALRHVRLVPGWVTACGRVNHLCICNQPKANSAFHPYGVDKSSTNLPLLGWRRDGHLCRVADNTVWSHWQVASRIVLRTPLPLHFTLEVKSNHNGIACELCGMWYHAKCIGISSETYSFFSNLAVWVMVVLIPVHSQMEEWCGSVLIIWDQPLKSSRIFQPSRGSREWIKEYKWETNLCTKRCWRNQKRTWE